MMIKDLFAKPIDRDIKGVIKVGQDDSSNVRQELEEYVVTRELQKALCGILRQLQTRYPWNNRQDGRLDLRFFWKR